jgi:hypothetical protein
MRRGKTTTAGREMTEAELKHLEELCAKATPGPWDDEHGGDIWHMPCPRDALDYPTEDDFDFIRAARDALPKLIAEVRLMMAKEKRLVDELYARRDAVTGAISKLMSSHDIGEM